MPRGTTYRKKYCQELIDHMGKGYSYESFAGKIGKTRKTLNNWEERYDDWLKAKQRAFSACQLFWEEQGLLGMQMGKDFNATVWIFNMKNRFGWTDRMTHGVEEEPATVFDILGDLNGTKRNKAKTDDKKRAAAADPKAAGQTAQNA